MLRGIHKASANWLGRAVMGVVLGLIAVSFGIIAQIANTIAQVVFFLFLALAFIALLGSALRGNSATY